MADETVPPNYRTRLKAEFAETRRVLEPHLVRLIAGLRREQVEEAVRRLLDYIDVSRETAIQAADEVSLPDHASALRRLHLDAIGVAFPARPSAAN